MEPDSRDENPSDSYTASERYFCPFPGCKRSFAELWRLKVHYRAPPDIRGSGKERGHGTELTHCPKCGKGLKPGKHHVGCSGGKTAPRQAKRQRAAAATPSIMPADGLNGDAQGMYGMGMPAAGYGTVPNGYSQVNAAPYGQQQFAAYAQQQPQQFQPDMSGSFYQGQAHPMSGGMMPMQPQQQPGSFQSPTLGMEPLSTAGGSGQQLVQAGSGDMMPGNQPGYQYPQQQVPLQQQPMMAVQQHDLMQQQQQAQQPGMDIMGHMQQQQQQQPMLMQPQIKQEVATAQPAVSHVTTASGAYLAQQHQQQQQQPCMVGQDQGYIGQAHAAATGLMPPPPPVPMAQMQQQQQQQQPQQMLQQPSSVESAAEQQQQQQQHMLPPAPVPVPPPPPPAPSQPAQLGQITSSLFDEIDNMADAAPAGAASGAADEASLGRAPSPPPLPPDFPQSVGAGNFTLFNFSQFNQKLPAQQGPSQQMAMMPRGMEQELPPSMDDLWTPEATYDHHSDGDLMQLLFGAPEQPPTMATIHLHHFLEDDACSSPLLGGLLGGSMDDLRAAEAKAGNSAAAPEATAAGDAAGSAAAPGSTGVKHELGAAAGGNGLIVLPSAMAGDQQLAQQQQQQQHLQLAPMQPKVEAVTFKADVLIGAAQGQLEHQQCQQQHYGPPMGSNGVIAGQCGSVAAMQVQMHMQVHGDGAGGVVQIKSEDGNCLLQQKAAVASLPEAVASRAT